MKKLIILFIFISFSLFSCYKESPCENSVTATLKNLTGLDGCGWVLVLKDGSKLEPVNLQQFSITLKDGKDVNVSFHEVEGASICMVGKIVEIDCLSER